MPVPRTRHTVALLLLCLFAAPRTRAASEFAGYRIPDHHWSAWSSNVNASGSHQRATSPPDFESTSGNASVRANTRLVWGRDSDHEQHALSLTGDVGGDRFSRHSKLGSPVRSDDATRDRSMSEMLSLFAGGALYPGARPIGMSLSGVFQSEYTHRWLARDEIERLPPAERSDALNRHSNETRYSSFASLGPVLGRVRDATPVLDARVLEDRLTRTGSLARPLSEQGRSRLVALLAMRGRFGNAHQRSERYFWREVERVLQEDGALVAGGLDALSVLRALEGVNPSATPRFAGRSLRIVATLQSFRRHSTSAEQQTLSVLDHDTLVARSTFASGTDRRDRADFLSVGYLADYHRPLGWRWQIDGSEQLLWIDSRDFLGLSHRLSAYWSVADRWRVGSEWLHSAASNDRAGDRKFLAWDLSHLASLQYQLEDAWGLTLAWRHTQSKQRSSFRRDDSFELGVSYLWSGRLTAPGLIEPMQLEPPRP